MASSSRIALENYLQGLDINRPVVFDVGGAQLPVKKRVNSFKCDKYVIIDLAKPHEGDTTVDYVMDLNVDYTVDQSDLIGGADLIFCLEVADYWYDPMHAMKQLAKMLKSGGILIVSFQLMYPTHNPLQDDCLRYTEFAIRKLAQRCNLTVEHIMRREAETDAIDQLWRKERMRAAKHYNHDVTGWIAELHN